MLSDCCIWRKFITFIVAGLFFTISFAISVEDARHLWSRTGFNAALIDNYSDYSSRNQAVNEIVGAPLSFPSWGTLPEFDNNIYIKLRSKNISKKDKRNIRKTTLRADRKKIQLWWYSQILNSNNPLHEKMTVFWHKHFTSDLKKAFPPFMLSQNQVFREYALTDFRSLLFAVMKNPAIHLYLDNQKNKKNNPNENLARELLELYTMGEGSHYSEEDIKGIAKSLTGYRINYKNQSLVFKWNKHDSKLKTIFSQTGHYNLDDVLNIVLEQPQVAEFIVIKLWHEFVSDSIPENEKGRLTSIFFDSDYDIKELLVSMLNSPYFWEKGNRNNLVKSPFDLLTSTAFLLDMPNSDSIKLPALLAKAGQKLFYPPDVRGWRGGNNWLNAELIISRKQLLNRYLNKLIKANKQENPDFVKDLNQKLNKNLQFFAIGQETPDRIKRPKNRLKFVLLNDYYHFK